LFAYLLSVQAMDTMHSIGQNIKSLCLTRSVSEVHRRSWTRLCRDLWTDIHQTWNIASLCHAEENTL